MLLEETVGYKIVGFFFFFSDYVQKIDKNMSISKQRSYLFTQDNARFSFLKKILSSFVSFFNEYVLLFIRVAGGGGVGKCNKMVFYI